MWGSELEKKEFGLLYPYFHGKEDERNVAKGIKKLRKLAEGGYIPAVCQLGICYFDHLGVRRNYQECFRLYLIAANEGYPSGEAGVGTFYGTVFPKYNVCDYSAEKAVEWWLKAAHHGNSGAQCNLAHDYLVGTGVDKNFVEAYIWSSMAVHCCSIRFRIAEVQRDQAVAQLTADQKRLADERIDQLKKILPLDWSDHLDYWRKLFAQATSTS